jgi:hypothetical protein
MSAEDELISDIGRFCRDPLGFTRYAWDWGRGDLEGSDGPRTWQSDILATIGHHLSGESRYAPLNIAVSSGHGIGKSALIAMVCNWAMSTCEDCRVVMTANTEAQLRTKTWPEVAKWTRSAINSHWWEVGATTISVRDRGHERLWRVDAIPWSDNNTEAFAGLHNKGKRIVVIYDEASAISDRIWEVTEGALTDADTEIIWLAFGNPTKNTGRFRECFGRYKHRWLTRQIDSRSVDGTNKDQLDKWIADYGEDSDFCRVRVRGEFPRAGSTQFIAGDVVGSARKRDVGDQSRAYKIMSVDVARFGDDQTVVGYRQGLRAQIIEKVRGLDVIQVGSRVIMHICNEQPRSCVIDGDGIGGGVVDYVRTYLPERWEQRFQSKIPKWFRLEEFHGGNTPGDIFMYFNKRAEVWGRMRDWLETAQIPDDPELDSDLTAPEYFFSTKNQIQLEKKEDMKKRGQASPDCGDMLAMTFAVHPAIQTHDEALIARLAATADPMERHFMRLRETERRKKAEQPLEYWQ